MAAELQFFGDPFSQSGLTITTAVYSTASTPALVGTGQTTELASGTAIYYGDVPAAVNQAGVYVVRFQTSSELISHSVLIWDGSAKIHEGTLDTLIDSVTTLINGLNDIAASDVVTAMEANQTKLDEIHKLHGLKANNTLTVTSTSRKVNDGSSDVIDQTITDSGTSTTVTRN